MPRMAGTRTLVAPLDGASEAGRFRRIVNPLPRGTGGPIEKVPEAAPLDGAKIGKVLEKPAFSDAKVAAVREYLHHEFPMCTIYDFHDHERNAQVIQLQDSQGKVSNLAAISVEFLEACGESEVRTTLETMRISQAMRQAGQAGVLVTPSGAEIAKR